MSSLQIGVEAVTYGVPLVMMELTMRNATNVAAPRGMAAPINQFAHVLAFPNASFKQVVRANVDTLYSSAFLDLSREPIVLSVPSTQGRYHLLPIVDAWTNVVASPGTRTTGNDGCELAIVGPAWNGALPAGMQQVRCPTSLAWILGRVQTNGPSDYAAVHAIQRELRLTPLSAYGTSYTPPAGSVDPSFEHATPPVEKLKAMSSATFFETLARLLGQNPAALADAPMLAKLASIGIAAGEPFDPARVDAELARALPTALQRLAPTEERRGAPHGWSSLGAKLGDFGTDYDARAFIALVAFGANLPADALYPTSYVDADGQPYDGASRYVLRFETPPPVRAFWSVTLYGPDSFFVENAIGRQAVSSWMPLEAAPDGSIEIAIQHEAPQSARAWLPSPAAGTFNLTLRMYWPDDAILEGRWLPPAVRRVR